MTKLHRKLYETGAIYDNGKVITPWEELPEISKNYWKTIARAAKKHSKVKSIEAAPAPEDPPPGFYKSEVSGEIEPFNPSDLVNEDNKEELTELARNKLLTIVNFFGIEDNTAIRNRVTEVLSILERLD